MKDREMVQVDMRALQDKADIQKYFLFSAEWREFRPATTCPKPG